MAGNPLIPQGTLNRLRGSVTLASYPRLNVTSSFLGKAGISLSLDGEAVQYIPTMTGAVTSPQPYMMVNLTIALLKTQALSGLYKGQMEADATLGDLAVKADSSALPDYNLTNCSIKSVRELTFAGEDAGWVVTLGGVYLINNNLWSLL